MFNNVFSKIVSHDHFVQILNVINNNVYIFFFTNTKHLFYFEQYIFCEVVFILIFFLLYVNVYFYSFVFNTHI